MATATSTVDTVASGPDQEPGTRAHPSPSIRTHPSILELQWRDGCQLQPPCSPGVAGLHG